MFDNMLYVAKIEYACGLNATEVSTDIYFSGCNKNPHCVDCHNKRLWEQTPDQLCSIDDIMTKLRKDKVSTVVCFLGGEPLDQHNIEDLMKIIKRDLNKKIMVYTGRTIDQVPQFIFDMADYIKAGPYVKQLQVSYSSPTSPYPCLASENQQLYKKFKGQYWYLVYPEPNKEMWK